MQVENRPRLAPKGLRSPFLARDAVSHSATSLRKQPSKLRSSDRPKIRGSAQVPSRHPARRVIRAKTCLQEG